MPLPFSVSNPYENTLKAIFFLEITTTICHKGRLVYALSFDIEVTKNIFLLLDGKMLTGGRIFRSGDWNYIQCQYWVFGRIFNVSYFRLPLKT